jgi:CheY-like chemotaxis protein
MGGEVGARGVPGAGSEFWFSAWFDLADASIDPVPAQPGLLELAGTAGAQTRKDAWDLPDPERVLVGLAAGAAVLLVEDNAVNQEVALELLQSVGLQVDLVGDGEQAVRQVCQRRYDLVLMDVQMPVLDGLQATRRIRALPGMDTLPIVAMTANAFGDDRDACLAAGMNDHVAKPVDPQQLYRTVLRWLLAGRSDGADRLVDAAADHANAALDPLAASASLRLDAADKAALVQALDQLEALFVRADFEALGVFRRLAPALRVHDPAQVLSLEAQLRGYDFEAALLTLQALRERLLMPS